MMKKGLLLAGMMSVALPTGVHAEDISWADSQYPSAIMKGPHAPEITAGIHRIAGNYARTVINLLSVETGPAHVINGIAYLDGCQPHMCMNFATVAFDGNGHYWGYLSDMDANYTHTYEKTFGHPAPEILKLLKNRGIQK
ncbi:hypothetical protein BGC31_13120 [Komagataeibacter xylinus]|nr:hypothetical protein H845_1769 [Komagataeibacter xylinus E25]RFP02404.1 hypothetical protein BFX83_13845 [Komagataeibacter xylinus]RFP03586.1 hypothetical protein BGC31_13120 [Komagataeibacter xylinus]